MRQLIPSAAASRTVMAAVVLGTALTAAGTRAAVALQPTRDVSGQPAGGGDAVPDVSKYCQACWRNARLPVDLWQDCTQQVLVRLLERVPQAQWAAMLQSDGEDKREFLRAIDAVKKRTQRARRFGELAADVAQSADVLARSTRDQWEAVNTAAEKVLSHRQRRIVELSATGWAVPDIAVELGTTPERVSDEKYKAIRKLRTELGVEA
jgi:DNA-directed RNA polymerase specialized sigma24 family protein